LTNPNAPIFISQGAVQLLKYLHSRLEVCGMHFVRYTVVCWYKVILTLIFMIQ
jgi:hypothetical protein